MRTDLEGSTLIIVASLPVGILRLDLDKESYERAGLVGKAIRDGGRKHVKTRFGMALVAVTAGASQDRLRRTIVVEVNLRLPSMLHGKKGFERIVWAFKNVLNSAVTWLIYDCEDKGDLSDGGTMVPAYSIRVESRS